MVNASKSEKVKKNVNQLTKTSKGPPLQTLGQLSPPTDVSPSFQLNSSHYIRHTISPDFSTATQLLRALWTKNAWKVSFLSSFLAKKKN